MKVTEEKKKKVTTDKEKTTTKKKKPVPKKEPKVIKPYVHIDTFLQTAIPLFGLTNIQAQGFKSRMNGRHYQRDEQVFVEELKKYLNLK